VPLPEGRRSDRVPQLPDDPALQKHLGQIAAAWDGRVDRLGPFKAQERPQWAVEAFGDVPADPRARAEWERKAGQVEAYRERYWDSPSDPIGPRPGMATPEKLAAYEAAAEALGRPADGPDVRDRDTGSLLLLRGSYEAETAWAPRFVSPQLRSVRTGAREAEFTRARAAAEARAAEARGDTATVERQQRLAASSVAMRTWYEQRTAELQEADQDYRDWSHATEGARRLAVAGDAELRRREPGLALAPLRTAEPAPVSEAEHAQLRAEAATGAAPGWIGELAGARPAVREEIAERQSLRVPDPEPDFGDQDYAWPSLGPASRDAIRQPAVPQMPPAPGVAREAGPEAGA
jgi:hypothetical protein